MPVLKCPNCERENVENAAFCANCGTNMSGSASHQDSEPLATRSPMQPLKIGGMTLSMEVLLILILILIQVIMSFYNANDLSIIVFDTSLLSTSLTPVFVFIGIAELIAAFGILRNQQWGMVSILILSIVDLGAWPYQTVVSILLILLVLYVNRATLLGALTLPTEKKKEKRL